MLRYLLIQYNQTELNIHVPVSLHTGALTAQMLILSEKSSAGRKEAILYECILGASWVKNLNK